VKLTRASLDDDVEASEIAARRAPIAVGHTPGS
jgi:hypothetical protein